MYRPSTPWSAKSASRTNACSRSPVSSLRSCLSLRGAVLGLSPVVMRIDSNHGHMKWIAIDAGSLPPASAWIIVRPDGTGPERASGLPFTGVGTRHDRPACAMGGKSDCLPNKCQHDRCSPSLKCCRLQAPTKTEVAQADIVRPPEKTVNAY